MISLGNDNGHHHPNRHVLRRLADANMRIYQTEWGTTRRSQRYEVRRRQAIFQGDVIITTDGQNYTISTQRTFDVDN